jgi:DNA processing protein
VIGVGTAPRTRSVGLTRASERDCWIALSLLPGIGPAAFTQLLARHGSAANAWRGGADSLHEIARDGRAVEVRLRQADAAAVTRAVEDATRRAGGRVLTWLDDGYPPALLTLDPRPPTLFVAGDVAAFERRGVAVVGTRRASGYGLSVATEIADELARADVVVISGLALGIDGAAHRAAVAAGGRSIAVIPSPLDRVYPPRHRSLAVDIVAGGGVLVSEVPPGLPVGRPDFARRNRIIAGLAEAVVVVEAPDRSGALLTAAAAIGIGRELYAVPGPIGAMASRGCNRLIADQQATIVTSTAALLRQIGFARRHESPAVAALSEVEGQVLGHLLRRSGSLEELVDRTTHPPAAVASALTLLEARGLVNPFGGATFHPTPAARRLTNGL